MMMTSTNLNQHDVPNDSKPPSLRSVEQQRSSKRSSLPQEEVVDLQNMLWLLRDSKVLQKQVPKCRRLVLMETLKETSSKEEAKQILIENVANSPYLSQEMKDLLVDFILEENLVVLREILECPPLSSKNKEEEEEEPCTMAKGNSRPPMLCQGVAKFHLDIPHEESQPKEEDLTSFREMVACLFSCSRKMSAIQSHSCREMGTWMYQTCSKEDLLHFVIDALKDNCGVCSTGATYFSQDAIENIANDFLDKRYDRLLLPNRFDCEELPRLGTCSREEFEQDTAIRRSRIQHRSSSCVKRFQCAPLRPSLVTVGNYAADSWEPVVLASVQQPQSEIMETSTVVSEEVGFQKHEVMANEIEIEIKIENLPEEETQPCPICFGSHVADILTPCQHSICHECANVWAGMTGDDDHTFQCPFCRMPIPFSLLEQQYNNEGK